MHVPPSRPLFVVGAACALAAWPLSAQAAGDVVAAHVSGAFDYVLAVGVALVVGLACAWLTRASRRATERDYAERVRQITSLIEHADCVLWEADVELRGDDWLWQMRVHSSNFARLLFREEHPQPGRDLWYRFQIEDREEMNRRARRALEAGDRGYVQEFRAVRDGEVLWLREDVAITREAGGRFRLVGLVTDVTARREAEAARQRSEQTVDSILAHAQCLLWRATVVRENGTLHWLHFDIPHSQFSELLFGNRVYTYEKGFWEGLDVPAQLEMNARSTEAILGGATGYTQQFQVVSRDGQAFWLNERVSIVQVGPDRWSLVGVATDITASHAAETARRRSETRLAYLLERADCLVWEATVTFRADGLPNWDLYTQRSVLYRRIFGDRDETELNWHTVNVPEFEEMRQRSIAALKAKAPGYTQEFRVVHPHETIWLREAVTVVEDSPGVYQLVGVITDITAQRRAEAARIESELRLATLLERADCMIWQGQVRRDAEGVARWEIFTPNSQLFRRLFGREPRGDAVFAWTPETVPEYVAMAACSQRALDEGHAGYEQVFRYRTGGREVWLNERVTIKHLGPGRWELIGIITDVTAQRLSEIAREASEARLQEVLSRADCLLWESTTTLTADGWAWDFNVLPSALCLRLYGTLQPDPRELLWRGFDIPERPAMNERCRRAMEEGRSGYEQVFRIRRPDGTLVWISESVTIRPLGGNRYSLVGVAVDITKQRGAEEALAAEKERLAVTLRAMHEAVFTADTNGAIQFMNPAAVSLTGWNDAAAAGVALDAVCRLEDARTGERVSVPVERVARGDLVADLPPQTRLCARDEQRRLVEGCCAPIHALDSRVTGIVLVLRDVTEQERLEQELIRATRLESVGVLAGGIAHDFNNILTAVMGNLTLAQLDLVPGSSAAASVRSAEKAALRARDLTQQLLTFAKGGEPVRAAVQLEAIVREMAAFALHGSQVKAGYDLAPDLWPADADKGQIGRVVQNLVINAVQAMPNGGTLRIVARNDALKGYEQPGLAPGSYIQILISDTGEGIRPEHLSQIFDPYFTTKKTGTGLGLAAVYSIIKKHRGHIEVESQVGQGTTFRLWLPALRGERPVLEPRAPLQTEPLHGHVLFMDDEEIIREMASTLLRRLGLTVECAADGVTAIERYRTARESGKPFDLVIMDLTVPGGMGGLQAVRELRAYDPAVKAIVSSGYSSDPVLANHREHGFVAVVAKPYEVEDLARVLRQVLAMR